MKGALPRIRKRIEDLRAFDADSVQERTDPRVEALSKKIDQTLLEIFGPNSIEYSRYRVWDLDQAAQGIGWHVPIEEVRQGIRQGIEQTVANLETICDLFTEKIELGGQTPESAAKGILASLDLHPEIKRAVDRLFADGHFANAVEDACKALDLLVKLRSGVSNLSGTELMQRVFSPKNPILRFNGLETESERSEQQGMMHLYSGAMLALRNPRAHELIEDHPARALEAIQLISFLSHSLDRAERL